MERPTRKPIRLTEYDYSSSGVYFITLCTKDRQCLFWSVGATSGRPQGECLSAYGKVADMAIQTIADKYSTIAIDTYVIMPNHIHLLLRIRCDESGRPLVAPTVSTVIQQYKGVVTKRLGVSVWQKSFYDHVVRNKTDYADIWAYIQHNPQRWKDDRLYSTI